MLFIKHWADRALKSPAQSDEDELTLTQSFSSLKRKTLKCRRLSAEAVVFHSSAVCISGCLETLRRYKKRRRKME